MRPEDLLNESIDSIKKGIENVEDKYESHIRDKATKIVEDKLEDKGLNKDDIDQTDYEIMVADLSKDIKQDYTKKAGQGLLAFIGLDMLLGL